MTHNTSRVTRLVLALVAALLVGSAFSAAAAFAAPRTISPFGACSHMLWGYAHADIDREMDGLAAAGGKWLRVDVSWRDVETSDNVYNSSVLSSLDYVISSASKRGITVQAVVMEIPDWANGKKGMWVPPTNDAKFGEFMHYLSARYAGRISYWELGNEVNETEFWAVSRTSSPARYTSFLKAGFTGVKAGNASAFVISAGLAGSDDRYLQQMYDAGAKGYFDLLGVHAYTQGRSPYAVDLDTPGSTYDGLAIMKATLERNGDADTKIWVTETGWQTSTSGHFVSQATQAQYVYEAYERVFQDFPYVEALFVYNLRNNGTDTSSSTDNFGLENRDYSHKAAFAAYRRAVDTFMASETVTSTPTTGTTVPSAPTTGTTAPSTSVTIKTSRTTVNKSRRVRLSGSVRTASFSGLSASGAPVLTPTAFTSGRKVVVQRLVGKKWKRGKTYAVASSGRYSVNVRPRARGTYRYRVVLLGTSTKSRTVRIRVH